MENRFNLIFLFYNLKKKSFECDCVYNSNVEQVDFFSIEIQSQILNTLNVNFI
jgi:hypothetical protein